ncbi:MAG: TOBE domain-containing protein [Rubrivivax sp.]
MRAEVRRLQRAAGTTMLYVTHDQDEALALSDRIVVMRAGRIEQDATPVALYERPATPFVAAFMGYENLFEWREMLHGARSRCRSRSPPRPMVARAPSHLAWRPAQVPVLGIEAARAPVLSSDAAQVPVLSSEAAQVPVPSSAAVQVPVPGSEDAKAIPGRVLARSYLGDAVQYLVDTALGPIKGSAGPEAAWQEGDAVAVQLDPARAARIRDQGAKGGPA